MAGLALVLTKEQRIFVWFLSEQPTAGPLAIIANTLCFFILTGAHPAHVDVILSGQAPAQPLLHMPGRRWRDANLQSYRSALAQ